MQSFKCLQVLKWRDGEYFAPGTFFSLRGGSHLLLPQFLPSVAQVCSVMTWGSYFVELQISSHILTREYSLLNALNTSFRFLPFEWQASLFSLGLVEIIHTIYCSQKMGKNGAGCINTQPWTLFYTLQQKTFHIHFAAVFGGFCRSFINTPSLLTCQIQQRCSVVRFGELQKLKTNCNI